MKLSGWGGQAAHSITIPDPSDQPPSAETTPNSLPGAMAPLQGSTPLQSPGAACTACRTPPPGGAAAEPDGDGQSPLGGWLPRLGWRRHSPGERATSPTAAAGGVRGSRGSVGGAGCASCGSSGSRVVRLVQVLSPALVGRAHVWGNKLAVRSTWVCVDAPYFEAPGEMALVFRCRSKVC
jgi:hypothetical protein